jgi:hypothetical protein
MTVRRLTVDDFDHIFDIYAGHTTFQGLPKTASIFKENNWDERWYNYHLKTFDNPNYYWFGDAQGDLIKSLIQYETWTKNGEAVVSNGWHLTNKEVFLPKSYGQKFWSDSIIDVCNYAVDFFEDMNINTCYATVRGEKALPDGWVAIASIRQCRLYNYTSQLIEEIPPGMPPQDPDLLRHVIKFPKTISQRIYKLTKSIS